MSLTHCGFDFQRTDTDHSRTRDSSQFFVGTMTTTTPRRIQNAILGIRTPTLNLILVGIKHGLVGSVRADFYARKYEAVARLRRTWFEPCRALLLHIFVGHEVCRMISPHESPVHTSSKYHFLAKSVFGRLRSDAVIVAYWTSSHPPDGVCSEDSQTGTDMLQCRLPTGQCLTACPPFPVPFGCREPSIFQ